MLLQINISNIKQLLNVPLNLTHWMTDTYHIYQSFTLSVALLYQCYSSPRCSYYFLILIVCSVLCTTRSDIGLQAYWGH